MARQKGMRGGATATAGAGGVVVAVVVGGGSMASTISLIDRVSKRGSFFFF